MVGIAVFSKHAINGLVFQGALLGWWELQCLVNSKHAINGLVLQGALLGWWEL